MRIPSLRRLRPKSRNSIAGRELMVGLGVARRLGSSLLPALCLAALSPFNAAIAGSTTGGSEVLPKRASGLWHIRTISESFGSHEIDACIGPNDDIVASQPESTCEPYRVERGKEEVIVTVDCKGAAKRYVTSVLFTGDFVTSYRGQSKLSVYDLGVPGIPETIGFTLDATFVKNECH